MFKLLLVAALLFGAWKGYEQYQSQKLAERPANAAEPYRLTSSTKPVATFACDGRKYCSQMTSCAEATYFLKNCPGVKMDGNNDGVPCEQQWCR